MNLKQILRRRKKVIKPKFQLQLAATTVVFLLLYSFVLGVAIFYPLASEYSATTDSLNKTQLAFTALKVHESLWPSLIIISILVFMGAVLVSHRIAGPLYRFEKTVEELSRGNFKLRTKLRKRDEFHEFADTLNALADYLKERESKELSFREDCEELLNEMAKMIGTKKATNADDLRPIVDRLITKYVAPTAVSDSQTVN